MLTYPLIRLSLLGSILVAFSGTLQAQTGLIDDQSTRLFSIEADGSSSLGTVTLQSGADIRFGVKTPSYTIGEGHDILLGRSRDPDEAKLRVAFKSPASLDAEELAGNWRLYKFEKSTTPEYFTSFADILVQIDTFTIVSAGYVIAALDGAPATIYAVNASKDLMVSVSSVPGLDSLLILVRLETGASTSQMAGSWTIGSFGIDLTASPTGFWYDGDTLVATSDGTLTLSDGPGNWSADGTGSITFSDGQAPVELSVSQSRNALVYTDSFDENQTHSGAFIIRQASAPSIASLAGDWTLLTIDLKAEADQPILTEFFFPGTDILKLRERRIIGQLSGSPAVEEWDIDGNLINVESWSRGVILDQTRMSYTGDILTGVYESDFTDGFLTSYSPTLYQEDGIALYSVTITTYAPEGKYTLTQSYILYYPGGIEVQLTSEATFDIDGEIERIATHYHPDGETIASLTTTTRTEAGTLITKDDYSSTGIQTSHSNTLNGKKDGLQESWNANGQQTEQEFFVLGIKHWDTTWVYHSNGTLSSFSERNYSSGVTRTETTNRNEDGTRRNVIRKVNGEYHGILETYDAQGDLSRETNYENGVKQGLDRRWHEGGVQLETEWNYRDGELRSLKSWLENGDLRQEVPYSEGLIHGIAYYYNSSKFTNKSTYVYGEVHEMETWIYYPNGTLAEYRFNTLKAGDLAVGSVPDSGWSQTWHSDGSPSFYGEFKNGRNHGIHRGYSNEGVLKSETEYEQGQRHGAVRGYKNGTLQSEREYKRDQLNGTSLVYNPANGIIIEEAIYLDDQLHGLRETFDMTDGSPTYSGEYQYDLKTGLHISWAGNERTEATYEVDILSGPWKYFSGNVLKESGQYLDGLKSGDWLTYNAGELTRKDEYFEGSLHRVVEYYIGGIVSGRNRYTHGIADGHWEGFSSGKLGGSTVYQDGLEVGPRKSFHENGQLSSNTPLVGGLVEGTVTTYDSGGRVGSTTQYVAGLRHGAYTGSNFNNIHNYLISSSAGSYFKGAACGTWTTRYYDSEGQLEDTESTVYGPCASENPFPTYQGMYGKVTANEIGVAGVHLSLLGASTTTTSDGSYFMPIGSSVTSTVLQIHHPDYPIRLIDISLPFDQIVLNNFTIGTFDSPTLGIGPPSVSGSYFLKDVPLPVTFRITPEADSGATAQTFWKRSNGSEQVIASDQLKDFTLNPGTDLGEDGKGGSIYTILSGSEKSGKKALPGYNIVPNPQWAKDLGGWEIYHSGDPNEPGEYRMLHQWPESENPLNFGVRKSDISEKRWILWQLVPFIGGEDFGIFDTYLDFEATAHTDGRPGTIELDGNADLRLGLSLPTSPAFAVKRRVTGNGKGSLAWGNTLSIRNASLKLQYAQEDKAIFKPTDILKNFNKGEKLLDLLNFFGKRGLQFSEWLNVLEAELAIGLSVDGAIVLYDNNGKLDILFAETKTSASLGLGLDSYFEDSIDLEANVTGRARVTGTYVDGSAPSIDLDSNIRLIFRIAIKGIISPYNFTLPEETTTSSQSKSELSGGLTFAPASYSEDDKPTVFHAENIIQTLSTESTLNSKSNDTPLVSNVYPYADPSMAYSENLKALAYIHYDSSRPEGLSTRVYYSVDSGSGFQAPQPVHDHRRSDFSPQLAFLPDGRLLAVWETSQADQIPGDLEERLSGLEIAWSIYDESTDTWSEPAMLTNDQRLDHQPQLANSATGPMLLWHSNETNALIASDENPDAINVAIWNDSQFEASSTIGYTIPNLGSVASAYDGTNAAIAWIQDSDNDLSTPNDSEVFRASFDGTAWSSPQRLTNDSQLDSTPTIVCRNDGSFNYLWLKVGRLVWLEDETTLGYQDLFSSLGAEGSSNYSVKCSSNGGIAVLWTELTGTQHDLRYAVYEPLSRQWSNPLNLTNSPLTERDPSLSLSESTLFATYVTENPDTQQRDLHTLECELGVDLAVTSISVDAMDDAPGQFELKASAENPGALPSGTTKISFFLGDPDSGGTYIGEKAVNLKGGQKAETIFQASNLSEGIIYARIDPDNTIVELDETNNTATSDLNPVNLEASYFTLDRSISDETTLTLSGTVTNNGTTEQIDIPVEITDESGVIHSTTLSSLAPGESAAVTTTIDTPAGSEHRFTLSVDPDNTLGEPDLSDNEFPLIVTLNQLKDNDGDGMENAWEELNFGTLDRDGRGDFDGDGLTDTFEFLTQNDPLDPKSKFPFTIESHPTDDSKVLIQFPSLQGRVYRIQRSSDLSTWTNESFHLGTGETISASADTDGEAGDLNGFRILVGTQ